MDNLHPPGPLPPYGAPGRAATASDLTAAEPVEEAGCSVDELTAEKITSARHAYYTAAAEAVVALQNGEFLSAEQVFAATYAQTSRAWWDVVDGQITLRRLACDHALRRVRSMARHFLTNEAPARRPGTLFDHALAHAARMAARDFLTASGELLAQHLATEPGDGADHPGPVLPVSHPVPGHPAASPAASPAACPAQPPTTAHTP
ncbi:hypothetical protein [Nonomuraea typhae]|uniref:hypothetical protein n=1 Tax=Nonomuraea typhae TaxID=2603600 RepID=UPI0012F99D7D|nr:hypothetical protein [Nonomuraea typhae]